MLEHLGESSASRHVELAVDEVLALGPRTPDLGGTATTEAVTRAVIRRLEGNRGERDGVAADVSAAVLPAAGEE